MTGSLNSYRGAGPAEATELPPLPGWSWGSEPGFGLSAYRTGQGAIQGRTPGLHRGPAIMGSDPRTPVWPYRLNRETW